MASCRIVLCVLFKKMTPQLLMKHFKIAKLMYHKSNVKLVSASRRDIKTESYLVQCSLNRKAQLYNLNNWQTTMILCVTEAIDTSQYTCSNSALLIVGLRHAVELEAAKAIFTGKTAKPFFITIYVFSRALSCNCVICNSLLVSRS